MTPNHDHATLFLAPSAPAAVRAAGKPESTVDGGAAAMHRLRHPFAVQAVRPAASDEAVHPA